MTGRIAALDAVRGAALFGVLMVNLLTLFRVSLFEQFLPLDLQFRPPGGPTTADLVVAQLTQIVLEWKAVTIFSVLFGVGVGALAEGAPAGQLVRRQLWLGVVGLVHLVFLWNGDILALYAALGLIVVVVRTLRAAWLVALALGLIAGWLALPWPFPTEGLAQHVAAANQAYGRGTFTEVLAFRVDELRLVGWLLLSISFRTLALMLLGLAAWKTRVFSRDGATLRRVLIVSGAVSLGIVAVRRVRFEQPAHLDELANLLAGLGVGSLLFSLAERRSFPGLESFGRLALTNYLSQSVVFGALFYGYGLGLIATLGEASTAVIGLGVFVAQLVTSRWWLSRFLMGPAEWGWRSLTAWRCLPLRR